MPAQYMAPSCWMVVTDCIQRGLSATGFWEGPVWKLHPKGNDRGMLLGIFRSSRDSLMRDVPCKYRKILYLRQYVTLRCVTSIPDPSHNRAGNGAGHRQAGLRPAFFLPKRRFFTEAAEKKR